jgi:hypothetical protein
MPLILNYNIGQLINLLRFNCFAKILFYSFSNKFNWSELDKMKRSSVSAKWRTHLSRYLGGCLKINVFSFVLLIDLTEEVKMCHYCSEM